jgi:hypothetical protein
MLSTLFNEGFRLESLETRLYQCVAKPLSGGRETGRDDEGVRQIESGLLLPPRTRKPEHSAEQLLDCTRSCLLGD